MYLFTIKGDGKGMKKFLISCILGISVSALVSCSNTEVNQDNIPNKYPINEFTEKGATL